MIHQTKLTENKLTENKVETWVQEILKLSEFAKSEPQAAYAAFSFGIRHKWTYFLRAIPDIEDLLQPL